MRVFERLKTGLILTKDSLLLIRHNPRLALFPAVGGLTGLAFLGLFLGVTFGLAAVDPEGGAIAGLFLAYLALTFVSSVFAAGLVHQTREVLAGSEPSLKAGIAAAWERKRPLLVWSLIAATVGIVINGLESSDSRIGRIVGLVFGVAWTLMTFFIIPVIVFERPSTTGMFKASGRKFRETYGETPISLVAVQLVAGVVAFPFLAAGMYMFALDIVLAAIALILVGLLVSFLLSQTLQGVVKTTLYLYAEEGISPEEFDNVDFDGLSGDRSRPRGRATSGGFR